MVPRLRRIVERMARMGQPFKKPGPAHARQPAARASARQRWPASHQGTSGDMKEAPPGFEPGMADLQSAALPLGEGAISYCITTTSVDSNFLSRQALQPLSYRG